MTSASIPLRKVQGRLLLRPSARTIRWVTFAVITGVAALTVWTGGRKGGDPAVVALPVATTLLCVWLCFLFEDRAAETTNTTATPLAFRRTVRAAIAVPAAASVWLGLTWIAPLDGPTAAMAGSFAAEVALALAAAAVAARWLGAGRSGLAAAGAIVFVAIVLPVWLGTPPSVDPASPPIWDATAYWSLVALVSVSVFTWVHAAPLPRR
ncbi:MAG: hypothetical protein M3O29_05335 [Actinomycetota bacterium]|nr:hypothetical protein [Actinomycetota bacterium]